ncbi:MAG: 3-hydroxyacyl-CoA dehydrogenase NAD-binding domain-containing protein, partial [Oscillospiraceae bacterium]|nr:3-hydroxyacyl-CoA dehydrogenase NAD-binding domain-containing protein [Oscillospiraceae bacterium]
MKIQNVVIAGGGVLGSQIAYQCSYAGFHVTTYLRSEASVERARPKVARLHGIYTAELQAAKTGATPVSRGLVMNQDPVGADFDKLLQKADAAYEGFHYETDLAAAVADADLVIEALAEQPEAKEAFFSQLSPLLPEKTIIATNSSTLLPSLLAKSTGRPAKFLALHFANNIWKQNIAEVMGHSGTA